MKDELMPWDETWIDIGGEGRAPQRVATRNNRGNGKQVTFPRAG